jgi:hypothetical protein
LQKNLAKNKFSEKKQTNDYKNICIFGCFDVIFVLQTFSGA